MERVQGTHFLVELALTASFVAPLTEKEMQQLSGATMLRLGTVSQSPCRKESA